MFISSDPLQVFPLEIANAVFSRLDVYSLGKCRRVSKTWLYVAEQEDTWKTVGKNVEWYNQIPKEIWDSASTNETKFKTIFLKILSKKLESNDEIIDRFQSFIDRVSIGQTARFRCYLSLGEGVMIAKIDYQKQIIRTQLDDFDLNEECFSIQSIGKGSLTNPAASRQDKSMNSSTQELRNNGFMHQSSFIDPGFVNRLYHRRADCMRIVDECYATESLYRSNYHSLINNPIYLSLINNPIYHSSLKNIEFTIEYPLALSTLPPGPIRSITITSGHGTFTPGAALIERIKFIQETLLIKFVNDTVTQAPLVNKVDKQAPKTLRMNDYKVSLAVGVLALGILAFSTSKNK